MPTGMQGSSEPSSIVPENLGMMKKTDNTKPYIGAKIIRAKPMTQEEWLRSQGKWQDNQETMGDGYEVTYSDNYKSWSPKRVFESAYREVEMAEIGLINR